MNNKDTDLKKKDGTVVAPDSTKSGNKNLRKDPDDNEGEGGDPEPTQPQDQPKQYRYFPPRRLPNPFESAAQEQEKFLQARKEALAKYSNISKNRYK